MLFTRLVVKNLYSFDDLDLDFTYTKKKTHLPLEGEFLENRPNFYVKRVCIFAGANATGKTSIGRVMCAMQNFIVLHRRLKMLAEKITDKTRPAEIELEFATPSDSRLHRCYVRISTAPTVLDGVKYAYVDIAPTSRAGDARRKLDRIFNGKTKSSTLIDSFSGNRTEELDRFFNLDFSNQGWNYLFSDINEVSEEDPIFREDDKDIFYTIMNSFDSTIVEVSPVMSKIDNKFKGFDIRFQNEDSVLITSNGNCSNEEKDRLSKGTYEAIKVVGFLAYMKRCILGSSYVFYIDEKLSASHVSVEMAILNVMINILPRNSQLFYTTHNSEIFDMNLPAHSYVFFRKQNGYTKAILPEAYSLKESLKEAVMNNVFKTLPDSFLMDSYFFGQGNHG